LTQVLMKQYSLESGYAARTAEDLIHALASANLFLVKGNWMERGYQSNTFRWEDIPIIADEFEGRQPWFPDGERN